LIRLLPIESKNLSARCHFLAPRWQWLHVDSGRPASLE
jgi:hypothetical protein